MLELEKLQKCSDLFVQISDASEAGEAEEPGAVFTAEPCRSS